MKTVIIKVFEFLYWSFYFFFKTFIIAFFIPIINKICNIFIKVKKNRIMFCSRRGESFSCNPKYIYNYLKDLPEFKDFQYIWVLNKNYNNLINEPNTIIVKYNSLKFYYYLFSSKIIIHNNGSFKYWLPCEKQLFVETWHGGGAYKRATKPIETMNPFGRLFFRYSYPHKNTLFISSSQIFTRCLIEADYHYYGKILSSGLPRNDILFNRLDKRIIKIKESLGLPLRKKIILYAPTWKSRQEIAKISLDFGLLLETLKNKFGDEWIILQRSHSIQKLELSDKTIDVSEYQDMQELLLISDVLLSDYSSCIWDYSFTYKPCFLFCPDLTNYLENFDFYIDIYKWRFPVAKNNAELVENIYNYNQKTYEENIRQHHQEYGSYELGKACFEFYRYISNFINQTDSPN